MKIAIISLWTPDIAHWCERFAPGKEQYCRRWGYTWIPYTDRLEPDRTPMWSKILAVQRHLHDFDWIFWIDADAVIVNHDFQLEQLCDSEYDVVVTHDHNGLNSGTFLIRNSPESHEFLRRVWNRNIPDLFHEQTAMEQLMGEMENLKSLEIPRRSMNSYWCDFVRGDFVLHAPGDPWETKVRMLSIALAFSGPAT